MGCEGFMKFILGFFNGIFALLGLGLLVVGCLVKWYPSFVEDNINPQLDKINTADGMRLDFVLLLQDTTLAAIVLGGILFVLGTVGILGVMCKSPGMMFFYALAMILIVLGEATVVVLMYVMNTEVTDYVKNKLNSTIIGSYRGDINSTEAITIAWNYVNWKFKCCGVQDHYDFKAADKWNPTAGEQIPLTCCRMKDGSKFPNLQPVDNNCVKTPTTNNSNYNQGCYESIEKVITDNKWAVIGGGAGIAVLQIVLIIAACYLRNKFGNKDKVDPM